MSVENRSSVTRWRLVLGRFASQALPQGLSAHDQKIEDALDFLYNREHKGRGFRTEGEKGHGGLDPSQLNVPTWINEVRELFPTETVEIIEKHALERYDLKELVTDKEVLEKMEPNYDLLKMVLTFRGQMQGAVLDVARRIIRQVVEEIKAKLKEEVRSLFAGRLNRFRHSRMKVAQNLDWRDTIRRNLRHYDPQTRKLLVQDVRFFSRVQRHMPWRIVLCVDQSGSMTDSVIYSAIMASILAGLPLLEIKLIIFDTNVVDLSEHADDPVEVLMSVQLGGGTLIGQAMRYCEGLVEDPHRTMVVLISDFCEGGPLDELLASCRRLNEARVKLIGLGALTESGTASYNVNIAEQLSECGMNIAAVTPKKLAEWIVKIISSRT